MDQGRFSVFPHENFVDLFLVQFGWEQCEIGRASCRERV